MSAINSVFSLVLLTSNPQLILWTIEADTIELNTIYNICYDEGKALGERWSIKKRFTQTIGWKWDIDHNYHADWWMWGLREPVDYRDGWFIFWIKPTHGDPIRVKGKRVIRTETFYDPEVVDREFYPEALRAGLYAWQKLKQNLEQAQ